MQICKIFIAYLIKILRKNLIRIIANLRNLETTLIYLYEMYWYLYFINVL